MQVIEVEKEVEEKILFLSEKLGMTGGELLKKIFLDSEKKSNQTEESPKRKTIPVIKHQKDLKEHHLIDPILYVLYSHGGKAPKSYVDNKIFSMYKEVFDKPYYQELVSNGLVPRWKHFIAWAKEAAKQKYGYIKPPYESGYGIWELTEKGKLYCEKKF